MTQVLERLQVRVFLQEAGQEAETANEEEVEVEDDEGHWIHREQSQEWMGIRAATLRCMHCTKPFFSQLPSTDVEDEPGKMRHMAVDADTLGAGKNVSASR